jgi:hypothetical protein
MNPVRELTEQELDAVCGGHRRRSSDIDVSIRTGSVSHVIQSNVTVNSWGVVNSNNINTGVQII